MAKVSLEYEDIKPLMPVIREVLRQELLSELEVDRFLSYPKGMQEYLDASYHMVYRLWIKKDFPRIENPKGVYVSELKKWQKLNS